MKKKIKETTTFEKAFFKTCGFSLEEGIKKAESGGWQRFMGMEWAATYLLDCSFWMALAEAEKWSPGFNPNGFTATITEVPNHLSFWLRFIENLNTLTAYSTMQNLTPEMLYQEATLNKEELTKNDPSPESLGEITK